MSIDHQDLVVKYQYREFTNNFTMKSSESDHQNLKLNPKRTALMSHGTF